MSSHSHSHSQSALSDGLDFVQRMAILQKVAKHKGCVNTVHWSEDGRYLLSGSDDLQLIIADVFDPIDPVKVKVFPGHRSNIFSAKFLPETDNSVIVSCAGDGSVIITDIHRDETSEKQVLRCHVSTTYEVATLPQNPNEFLTCGEDGTVRLFDRRQKVFCIPCRQDILIDTKRAVCAIDVNPRKPHMLACGCSDSTVRLYDIRMLDKRSNDYPDAEVFGLEGLTSYFCIPESGGRGKRVTSLDFSRDGTELLASFSGDHVYLIDVEKFSDEKVKFPVMDDESKLQLKKVRLRGDWSDTGPSARPESEVNPEESGQHQSGADVAQEASGDPEGGGVNTRAILGRFTSLLTRWLERQITGEDDEEVEHREEEPSGQEEQTVSGDESNETPSSNPTLERDIDQPMEESTVELVEVNLTGENHTDIPSSTEVPTEPQISVAIATDKTEQFDSTLPSPTLSDEGVKSTQSVRLPICVKRNRAESSEVSMVSTDIVKSTESAAESSETPSPLQPPIEAEISGSDAIAQAQPAEEVTPTSSTSMNLDPLDIARTGTLTSCEYDHHNHRVSVHREENITDFSAKIDVKLQVSLQGTCCSTLEVQVKTNDEETPVSTESQLQEPADVPSTSAANRNRSLNDMVPQSEVGLLRSGLIALRARRAAREGGSAVSNSQAATSASAPETPVELTVEETEARDNRRRLIVERLEEEVKKKQLKKQTFLESLEKLPQNRCKMIYKGHRNVRTMLKQAGFWGNNFIMSGSDCGHIFFWDKQTGEIATLLEADKHVVNCVRPHPTLPVLASSGIDYDVKIWASTGSQNSDKVEQIQEVVRRNELMLSETRDTVTVPAAFMIRMLASMNRVRRGRDTGSRHSDVVEDD